MLTALSLGANPAGESGGPAIDPPEHGVEFDGRTGYAVVREGRAFDLPVFTLAAWVKLRQPEGSQVFVNRGQAGTLFTLYLYDGKVRMLVAHQEGKYTHADAPPPEANAWTHYAGTYDGDTIKVYLNGVLQDTAPAQGRIEPSDAALALGSLSGWERHLDGWLEHVRIWDRALDAQEIAALVAGTAGETALNAGLVGHWHSGTLAGDTWRNAANEALAAELNSEPLVAVRKDTGYRGIWYYNQPSDDEYVYKYSGGLGTYCAKHIPFAYYAEEVNKTFFCYGGTVPGKQELLHMVSCYDHSTGTVPRPTILLNKHTSDAHDNPVIMLDDDGYVWIFSSAHGTSRPAHIHRSKEPYSVDDFEHILTQNFSYPQPWYLSGKGFLFLHTRYKDGRCLWQMTSPDGVEWSNQRLLSKIENGHYQISWRHEGKVGTAFNLHPDGKGVNWRTNLYYMQSDDFGNTWRNVQGDELDIPLSEAQNPALVHDYRADGLLVYLKDISYDSQGRPIILHITSNGYESGPENMPRTWRTARWTGNEWDIQGTIVSDNNYDMGSLYVESDTSWRIIAPTETGPQPYNPGGEIAVWTTDDAGKTWTMRRQLTNGSEFNHTYVRRPVNAQPDFYGFWADGHGRQPSDSRLYFTDRTGERVWRLPPVMEGDSASPEPVP